jgi:ABC-2 type transport system permease protein
VIIAARLLRDRRRSLAWWALGMAGLVFTSAVFYPAIKKQPSLDQLMRNLPQSLKAFVGEQAGVSLTSPAGYLHGRMFTILIPALLLVFAIGLGARAIAGSEEDGTLELLLANPVSRTRVAAERFAGVAALIGGLGLATFAALLALSAPFGLLQGVSILRLAAATLAVTSLAMLHASIAFAAGSARPGRSRATATAAAVAVAGYIVFGLVNSHVISWARFVDPWWWYLSRNILVGGLPPEAVVVPLGCSAILGAAGVAAFSGRDLR